MVYKQVNEDFLKRLDKELQEWLLDFQIRSAIEATTGFSPGENTEEKRLERIEKCKDFKPFKKTYFPAKIFRQGFAKSPVFHDRIDDICDMLGIHFIIGPRGHGKTTEGRIKALHNLLYGFERFSGSYSEDLDVAQSWVAFLITFLSSGRIYQDFRPDLIIANKEEVRFSCCNFPVGTAIFKAYGSRKSRKGQLDGLDRPEHLYGDDIETNDSSMTEDAIRKRLKHLEESFKSLSNEVAKFTIFCNNFNPKSLVNVLLVRQDNKVQNPFVEVHLFPIWNNGKPLWFTKYPARTIEELKILTKSTSDAQWAEDMGRPIDDDGNIFDRDFYGEYDSIPNDVIGVIYTDQNLAKKGKGDTTAITPLYHSRHNDCFYVVDPYCRNTTQALTLFNAILDRYNVNIVEIGMDGNVSQESYWTDLLIANEDKNQELFWLKRYMVFKNYKVDNIATNAQILWEQRKILFPKGFKETTDGKEYLSQLFSFRGKKAGKKDDAPDSLICAIQMIYERGLGRRSGEHDFDCFVINDDELYGDYY